MEQKIIEFEPRLATEFERLNKAWLQKFFYIEPLDEEVLSNPQTYIIDKGGFIFFALMEDKIAGTVALIKKDNNSFEVAKMAVDEAFQGNGLGKILLEACIEKGKKIGATSLFLFSNTILEPAIHLYKKFGFTEVPIGNTEYKRSNIKMEKLLV